MRSDSLDCRPHIPGCAPDGVGGEPGPVVSHRQGTAPASLRLRRAVAMVERIMSADYADDAEAGTRFEELDRAFGCPSGYVAGLIFWPIGREPAAEEVVAQADRTRRCGEQVHRHAVARGREPAYQMPVRPAGGRFTRCIASWMSRGVCTSGPSRARSPRVVVRGALRLVRARQGQPCCGSSPSRLMSRSPTSSCFPQHGRRPSRFPGPGGGRAPRGADADAETDRTAHAPAGTLSRASGAPKSWGSGRDSVR